MAHTCPVCGQTCYCNGDIDDIILDTEEAVAKCTHCSEYEDDSSQCDYCDAAVRADKAERERDEAVAAVAGKDLALQKVLGYIDEFCCDCEDYQGGGECTRDVGELDCDRKAIGNIVVPTLSPTLGADILQKMREQDAALATMRGALEHFLIGAKHMSCMYEPDDPDPTWHCCNWSEVVEQIEKVLSSPAGKDLLERLRQAEELLREALDGLLSCQPCDISSCGAHRSGHCNPTKLRAAVDAFLKGGGKGE